MERNVFLMVGYAASHDESGNWKNIDITLLDTDDAVMESYGCAKFRYLYNRDTAAFTPVFGESSENVCDIKLLKNIVSKFRTQELKSASSVSVMWRSFPDLSIEITDVRLCEEVWLPMPVIRDGAECELIDVTQMFFGKTAAKPLEISIAVYVLNYLVWMSSLKISTVFFDCRTRMFMNCDFLRQCVKIFGTKPDFANQCVLFADYAEKHLNFKIFKPQICVNTKKIIKNIKVHMPDCALYEGDTRRFAVAVKNDCVKRCADSLINCICSKSGHRHFISELMSHIQRAISEYRVLSELFVAGENLYRTGDIMYLGLDGFLEACAFGESLLNLKKTVRDIAECCKALNSQKIPDIITGKGEYIYLKG